MLATNSYSQSYNCWQNAPLNCDSPWKTAQKVPDAKFCSHCGFPATLSTQTEIRGSRGVYRITEFVRSQGRGRLYNGFRVSDNKPVVIKEYLLPSRCFNSEETQKLKAKFTQIAGASPINNQSPDFRLIAPWEAISDRFSNRCYLITLENVATAPNLRQVLEQNGAMPAERVRDLLAQVLQTLYFLHTQKLQLPSGQVRTGIAHGNLNLKSLILADNSYIYTCDLAFWERLFDPPPNKFPNLEDPALDLVALGHVAIYLGLGRDIKSASKQLPDFRNTRLWSKTDPALRKFIYHLLGLETPFPNALVARQALLQLPTAKVAATASPHTPKNENLEKQQRKLLWLVVLMPLLLLGVGGLLWINLLNSESQEKAWITLDRSFNDVNVDIDTIATDSYPYSAERNGTWTTALGKKPLSIAGSLDDILTDPRADIAKFYHVKHKSLPLFEMVLEQNDKANFAVTSLIDKLPVTLKSDTIAYDSLLVFVPAYKAQNLPAALQGKISLNDLRKIFTLKVKNWQELDRNLPDLRIIPYRPLEPEALKQFEQIVLNNDPKLIAESKRIEQRSTFATLREIGSTQLEAGTISFGTYVQTWDQCKVYPLALMREKELPVQALLRETTDNQLVPITPADDRCQEKKPLPNVEAYRKGDYPLGFPLKIVYPDDNSLPGFRSGPIFAKLLKTRQGQCLLQQSGLVPLQSIPKYKKSCESLLHS